MRILTVKNMDKQEWKGKTKKVKGKIREEVGKLTGNRKQQLKGKVEQVEGEVREEFGKVRKKINQKAHR